MPFENLGDVYMSTGQIADMGLDPNYLASIGVNIVDYIPESEPQHPGEPPVFPGQPPAPIYESVRSGQKVTNKAAVEAGWAAIDKYKSDWSAWDTARNTYLTEYPIWASSQRQDTLGESVQERIESWTSAPTALGIFDQTITYGTGAQTFDPAAVTDWGPAPGTEGMAFAGGTPMYSPSTGLFKQFNESTGEYDIWGGNQGIPGGGFLGEPEYTACAAMPEGGFPTSMYDRGDIPEWVQRDGGGGYAPQAWQPDWIGGVGGADYSGVPTISPEQWQDIIAPFFHLPQPLNYHHLVLEDGRVLEKEEEVV